MSGPGVNTRVFVDSNVWLYSLIAAQDPAKTRVARQLISQNQTDIVLSSQVVIEVVANLIKQSILDERSLRRLIQDIYHGYQVVDVNKTIMLRASELRAAHSFSYWDSLIVAAALESEASTLYSEDMQNGLVVENQLTIVNPFSTASS